MYIQQFWFLLIRFPHFSIQNNELAREVQSLRSEKELVQRLQCQVKDLEEENLKLREELRCARVQSTPESTGSAVSTSPLPQGRSSAPTLVLTSLLIPTMIFHLTIACLGSMISNLSKTSSRTSFPVSRMKKWVVAIWLLGKCYTPFSERMPKSNIITSILYLPITH